jgi:ferric-dicitrate binding protein FerR (iron transport regulator)
LKSKDLYSLIKRFLAGKTTQAEEQALEQWWENPTHDKADLDALSDEEWETLKREMEANIHTLIETQEGVEEHRLPVASSRRWWTWAAASIVLLMAVGIFVWNVQRDVVIQTSYGERRSVTLPDQSVVMLNGNSSLRYSKDWTANTDRDVWLEGEGFFTVKHTANHNRFTVHTPDELTIQVLGTQFNVTNRNGKTDVVLQEGSVRLEDKSSSYLMKPNEMVHYTEHQQAFVAEKVAVPEKVSWKTNLLIYSNETVGSIVDQLSDSYGWKVEFENAGVRDEIFNGSIPTDSIEVFFEKIEKLYGVTVEKQDDEEYVIR